MRLLHLMTLPKSPLLRLLGVCLVLAVLWLTWQWNQPGGSTAQHMPPLRIVCQGGDNMVRCPSDCQVGDDGQAQCRCQDFYYRRGDKPLAFSHTLCR